MVPGDSSLAWQLNVWRLPCEASDQYPQNEELANMKRLSHEILRASIHSDSVMALEPSFGYHPNYPYKIHHYECPPTPSL